MINLNVLKQSTLVHLCFGISYFASGILINFIQAILYFGLKPINKDLYRKLNYYLLYSFYSQLVFMSEWWAGCKINIYVDKDDFKKYYGKEHGYLIMNHTYDIDWLMGWQFCDYIQVLGNCKAYAKKSIQYVPPIGWMWKFGEFVFLERSFDKDKEIISHQIAELSDYPDPIWLLMFPEGTRFTKKKHEASVAFAESKGFPKLKHHLTPRTKGFTTSLPNMRGKIPAIYDIQVAFSKSATGQPTITSLLFGAGVEAHLYIRRIPLEQVPLDEEGAAQWLHQLFILKDKVQDSYVRTGDFFADSGVARIEPFQVQRRVYSLINTLGWAVLIIVPLVYRILLWLLTGEFLWFCGACLLLGAVYVMMLKTIGMSQISQGSSYGAESKRD